MNVYKIGELIAEEIINAPGICFYPARFKAPHKGHWRAVQELCSRNYITKVVVLISPKTVDGITQEDSYKIWSTILKSSPNAKVTVHKAEDESPIKDIYKYLGEHPLDKAVYVAYNQGEEDDSNYIQSLQKDFGPKVKGIAINDKDGDITSPKVRDSLEAGDYDGYVKSLPDAVIQKGYADEIFKIVAPHAKPDPKEDLKEVITPAPIGIEKKLQDFLEYVANNLEITNIPSLEIIKTSGFTQKERSFGGYHPAENKIYLVATNRNLADIMRSLAHELVHAKQNQESPLTGSDGTTGSEVENQANAVAGVILRLYGQKDPSIYLDFVSAE